MIRYAETELPKSIEEQLAELMAIVTSEQERLVRPQDIDKVVYLRDYCISDHHLEPYDYVNIEEAKKHIIGKLRERKE